MKNSKTNPTQPQGKAISPAGLPPIGGPLTVMLLDVTEVARLLSVSKNTIWKLRSTGDLPAPIRLGKLARWRRDEIEAWVRAGCPLNN